MFSTVGMCCRAAAAWREHKARHSYHNVAIVAFFCLAISASAVAQADPPLACRQLGAVGAMSTPAFDSGSTDINLQIGSHYWACPCGEARKLVGDNEQRKLVGDSEQRKLVGDSEQRKLVGDSEQRKLVGDSEQRKLVGDSEQRKLVGDSEQRKLVGDAGGIQCLRDASCDGFRLLGVNVSGVKVFSQRGAVPVTSQCVSPY